jgi:hypothetical protein
VNGEMEIDICRNKACEKFLSTRWVYCPCCGTRQQPQKLTPTGDAGRDRLVAERINLRAGATQ